MNLEKEFVGDGLGIKCPKRPLPVNVVLQRPGHPWIIHFSYTAFRIWKLYVTIIWLYLLYIHSF